MKVSELTPSGKHRDFGRPARNVNGSPGPYKGYVKGPIDSELQADSDCGGNCSPKPKSTKSTYVLLMMTIVHF
jgi:hypothetical protein